MHEPMTETYRLLREAHRSRHAVLARYDEKDRVFRVMRLGWTDNREFCHAWIVDSDVAKWRCFEVAKLVSATLGPAASEFPHWEVRGEHQPTQCLVERDDEVEE